MGASVKIMLSYDYCHFEVSKSTNENLSDKQINELRKHCQRLADEAVRQYVKAKKIAEDNSSKQNNKDYFEMRLKRALEIPESERSEELKAIIKQSSDKEFLSRFEYDDYDYEDDDDTYDWEDDQ